jgi:hypothetical protein
MFEAAANDFPFVKELPRREKSTLARLWELVRQMNTVSKTEGQLIPLMLAAKCLGVSRSRIDQLILEGRVRRMDVDGHVFVTENSLVEFAKLERKNGRPLKALEGNPLAAGLRAALK